MYLLGYIPKDNKLYLGDKELNIVSYSLLVSVLEYQTAVMRRDFCMADKVLPTIPKEQRTRVAHFLEKQVKTFDTPYQCNPWLIKAMVKVYHDVLSCLGVFNTSSLLCCPKTCPGRILTIQRRLLGHTKGCRREGDCSLLVVEAAS